MPRAIRAEARGGEALKGETVRGAGGAARLGGAGGAAARELVLVLLPRRAHEPGDEGADDEEAHDAADGAVEVRRVLLLA